MTDPQPANVLAQHIAAEITTAANEVNASMSVLRSELEKWAEGLGASVEPRLRAALAAIGEKAIAFNQTVNKVTAPAGTVTGFPGHPLNFAEIEAQGGAAIPRAPAAPDEAPKVGDVIETPVEPPAEEPPKVGEAVPGQHEYHTESPVPGVPDDANGQAPTAEDLPLDHHDPEIESGPEEPGEHAHFLDDHAAPAIHEPVAEDHSPVEPEPPHAA